MFVGAALPAFAYYHPEEGRWLSRDPIGERYGYSLYLFVQNEAIGSVDFLGLWEVSKNWPAKIGMCAIEYKKTDPPGPPPFVGGQSIVVEKTIPHPDHNQCQIEPPGFTCKWPDAKCKIVIYLSPGIDPNGHPKGSSRTFFDHESRHVKCHADSLDALYDKYLNPMGCICCSVECIGLRLQIAKLAEQMFSAKAIMCSANLDLEDTKQVSTPEEYAGYKKKYEVANKSAADAENQLKPLLDDFKKKCTKK